MNKRKIILDWAADIYHPSILKENSRGLYEKIDFFAKLQKYFSKNSAKSISMIYDSSEKTREYICELLNIENLNKLIFTTGTCQGSQNIFNAIFQRKGILITTNHEIPQFYFELENLYNFKPRIIKIDENDNENDIVFKFIEATKLLKNENPIIFLSYITYDLGIKLPIKKIIYEIKKINKKILVIVDGSQAFGQIEINLKELDVDFFIADFHKWIQGPNYVGFIYSKDIKHINILKYEIKNMFAVTKKIASDLYYFSKSGFFVPSVASAYIRLNFFKNYIKLNQNTKLSTYFINMYSPQKFPKLYVIDKNLRSGIISFNFDNENSFNDFVDFMEKNKVIFSQFDYHRIRKREKKYFDYNFIVRFSLSDIYNTKSEVEEVIKILKSKYKDN